MSTSKVVLLILVFGCVTSCMSLSERLKIMGPVNVGREYGSPSLPVLVSHIPKKNQEMLYRGRAPHHTMFTRILCFKKYCRVRVGRTKALHSISFDKYKKKIRKHDHSPKKSMATDTVKRTPIVTPELPTEPKRAPDEPVLKADSLIIIGGELLFETNRSTLSSDHFPTLNSIVEFLSAHPSLTVKISGHTDNTGTESHNKTLSTQRADVVAEYLVDNGINIERVSSVGLGSLRPIAPNTTNEGRKKNRRVELLIHDSR